MVSKQCRSTGNGSRLIRLKHIMAGGPAGPAWRVQLAACMQAASEPRGLLKCASELVLWMKNPRLGWWSLCLWSCPFFFLFALGGWVRHVWCWLRRQSTSSTNYQIQ
jgi:hypothetical protein